MNEGFRAEKLTPGKRELLEPLLEQETAYDAFPMSYAQQRLWVLDQLEQANVAYNLSTAIHLKGKLRVSLLEACLSEIVFRHESLRTTFSVIDEQPVQLISPTPDFHLLVIDLSHLAPQERGAKLTDLMTQEVREPFDLSRGPLLRARLFKLAADEHTLLLVMHHIVSDGWSMGILFQELTTLYRALARGEKSPLPELEIQYADYAQWQREWLQGERLEEQLGYWEGKLASAPSLLELPTDHPRPALQQFRGHRLAFHLPARLTEALKQMSRREGVTLFMLLLAAFQALLSRYSGQGEVVVGTPAANRNRGEVEGLIGFFVNTLVIGTRVRGGESFAELLREVKEACLGAYAHQDVPFELLLERLQPERNASYNPLFQVMFQLQNAAIEHLELPGLSLKRVPLDSGTSKFDLMMSLEERERQLTGWIEYNSDLFEAPTIERMIGHFSVLLEGIVKEPARKLTDFQLMTEAERQQLTEWNKTETAYPKDLCVHQLFETQVERSPNATALVYEDERLTYGELNDRVNQLAHHLQTIGITPETLVAILMDRSAQMVISLLAILKAGGAYVPLDPAYPLDRISFMLEDANVKLVLTERAQAEKLSAVSAQVLFVDEAREQIARQETANPASAVLPQNLAYVIYTSGSTGTPKGVQITHLPLTNFLASMSAEPGLAAQDVLAAITTLSFDIAGLELYLPLINGGSLVVIPRSVATDGVALAAQLEKFKATAMQATPSTWHLLTDAGWSGNGLRKILCGGEALDAELAKHLTGNNRELWNLYGPTETTIWSLQHKVQQVDGIVPIGKPIANTQVYIVDRAGHLAPIGVSGELCIGGDGLARGYLKRAAQTAEKFVPDSFSGRRGERLYRTGDLARYKADGTIEFLGRIDHQVKVRGYRIELGEIEAALRQQEQVKETVVVAREDGGEKRLVAYVVAEQAEELSISELREHLKGRLPEYMVPALFVPLEKMPLTPNGKVDRKALPAPDQSRARDKGSYVAPRNPVEGMLAGIWMQLLNVGQIGVYDNFFELGGHSLLATRLLSRVRSTFGVELPLDRLFAAPTVAGMAEQLEARRLEKHEMVAQSIVRAPRDQHLLLSYPQLRLWFLDQLEPGNPAYNVRVGVRLTGRLNITALEQSLTEIVRRHESLRTNFKVVDGEPLQVIAAPRTFTLGVTDLTHLPESEREAEAKRIGIAESQTPFDLSQDLMLRARLARLADDDYLLILMQHHIASDGWSVGILFRELSILYNAYVSGENSPLDEPPIQYADFAQWQRHWLQGDVLEEQLGYWQRQLAGGQKMLRLPTDRPRSALVQLNWGMPYHVEWSREITQSLKALSRREGVTLYMLLLAAYQSLLCRYAGQDDFGVGTPIANRTRSELEGLIGFFINTLVMRADLSDDPTFSELLKRTRKTCVEAYTYQDVPFEKVVERLQPERNQNHNPLFQVLFQVQNAPTEILDFTGIDFSPVTIEGGMMKLDLAVGVKEVEDKLSVTLRYNTELFNESTIARMATHFGTLLESVIANPEQRISQLPLATPDERQQLKQWNETRRDFPSDSCIHQLFQAQAERTPDAPALLYQDERLTYSELNERANQLAHHLQQRGITPEALVAVLMDRSPQMIISLLAILKAGAAYLPVDPAYPLDRISFMLEDANVKLVLTERAQAEKLSAVSAQVLFVDEARGQIARQQTANPASAVLPQNLAYVIYTSGSTGTPKAVLIEHRSLANFTTAAAAAYSITAADRVLQFASFSFDTFAEETFPALCTGAALILRGEQMLGSTGEFLHACRRHALTVLDLPTAFWHELVRSMRSEPEERLPRNVRLVIIGGERAQRERAQEWMEVTAGQDVQLVNTYGPTEATVVTTACEVSREAASAGEETLIGRPIANTQVYIVGRGGELTPVGVGGELCIGGEGLARGYLKRAGQTAEKFIPDGFSGKVGSRLYRTGDLARYRADGAIEFLGRIDHQVKVRGYRVELGEVEAALTQHEAVKEAVVIAREDEGEKRLVAYVVAEQAEELSVSELRGYLREKLPEYMMPSAFVAMEEMPLTRSGKVDRKALPAPDRSRSREADRHVAPRTPVEDELAAIWMQLLKVDYVDVYDNFFELGGHSLLLTQLASSVRRSFQVELSLGELFATPTIDGIVRLIAAKQLEQEDAETAAQMIDELSHLSADEIRALLEAEGC